MWSWAPWSSGHGWGEEKEETKKQQNMVERQRQPHVGYYQRSKTRTSETVAMEKGKVKPPGGAIKGGHSQQQVGGGDEGEDWENVGHEDLGKLQQQVPEAKTESGTDPQTARKKPEEYRKQREAARMEVKALKQELAQSRAEVEWGGNMVAQCEKRIHELEAEVSNMHVKHEAHIKQLKQEHESIIAQKEERSREAVTRARTFGGDPSASAHQQLEASYQTLIHQKEREIREKEHEFQRKQRHYLTQITQLEDAYVEAKMREAKLREDMERMKAEHQFQLHKLCGSIPDSSLDEDSCCPSNPIDCQPTSTDVESKLVTGGVEQTSVELQHLQRVLSRDRIGIDPAELANLGARERRTVQRTFQQLQNDVDLKDNEIKMLSDQLEQKEKRITALSRTIEVTRKNTEKGLRHLNEDSYLDQLTVLTGQLSALETSDRAQKNELAKLRVKVKEAEAVTGQLDGVVEHVTDLETENQALKQQVVKLQKQAVGEATDQHGGTEVTYQSYNREVMAELKRLQPLEAKVEHLQKELTEAQEFRKETIKLDSQVVELISQVSEKEKEVADLQSEKTQLEARISAMGPRDVEGEIARMREQLFAKEEELTRLKSERVAKTGGQKDAGYAEIATRLKIQLDLKEKDNLKLRSQVASLAALLPPGKPTPKPRTRDAATDQSSDQPPPLDPPTDVVELQKILEEKEAKIARMGQQVQKFEKTATDLTKCVHHVKGQTQIVKELRQPLERAEGEAVTLRLQLAAQRSEQDLLYHQLEQTEAMVRQLGTNFNLSKARVAELEGEITKLEDGITEMQTALSESEHHRQELSQELAKVKKQRDILDQKYLSVLALNENLKSQASQVDHVMDEITQVRREASKWKKALSTQSAELSKLRGEVGALRRENDDLKGEIEAQKSEVKKFAEESEEWQSRAVEWNVRHDTMEAEVQQERSWREALERRIADLEIVNDQLRQEGYRENEQLRQQILTLTEQIQRYPQQAQSRLSHQSDFWEVPRNEITLNMHKILGIGAWGFVVEGLFRSQKVAVKCLHDMIRQPKVIELIRKEIGIMAQIRHPNMVMLIAAVIDEENDPLIITELLDVSLRKAYEKHLLRGSSKLSIFRDVASALNYLHLHQRGEIIHRDVSSANVLLEAKPNNQWKAKLSDFGSAKLAIEAKTTGPGAPAYTAPEVQREMGIHQTAKLDVYSYGILLCEVIVEQFPMDGSLPSMVQTVQSRWPFMHGLVTSCIKDHPDNRPTMSYVLGEFDKLRPKE